LTIIARERSQRRLRVRCDIVGRDQGGFIKEAQELFEQEIEVPAGYRVTWLGMFKNLQRARTHFATLIPVTIVVIFSLLVVTFGSYRAVVLLLLLVPFAFIGGAMALYVRGMHLNVSTGVGFAALFPYPQYLHGAAGQPSVALAQRLVVVVPLLGRRSGQLASVKVQRHDGRTVQDHVLGSREERSVASRPATLSRIDSSAAHLDKIRRSVINASRPSRSRPRAIAESAATMPCCTAALRLRENRSVRAGRARGPSWAREATAWR
jgi:hypothetical protein